MIGSIPILNTYAYALFDPGATHSFISTAFVEKYVILYEPLEAILYFKTLVGGVLVIDYVCKSCAIRMVDKEQIANLIVLKIRTLMLY